AGLLVGRRGAGRLSGRPTPRLTLPLGAEEQVLLLHPLGLAGGEFEVAGVVRVVHVVMDRIEPGLEAGVPADLAPEGGSLLGGRVGDVVALRVTTALESVVQPEPVAALVRRGEAEVVRPETGNRAARHRAEGDDDAVHVRPRRVPGREVRPPEVLAAVDRVDVQRVCAALAKRALRFVLVFAARGHVEPAGVRRAVVPGELESEAGIGAAVEAGVAS